MSLREASCYSELADDLRRFTGGRKLVEILNSGNWGDALIHAGQAEFLSDEGHEVQQMPVRKLQSTGSPAWTRFRRQIAGTGRAIVTASGAYREFYDRPKEISIAARQFGRVLVMPSSYPFRPELCRRRTTLWRRDHGESKVAVPEARFCHDMAFYLRPTPRTPSRPLGLLFREDREKGEYALPEANRDISAEGTHLSDPERFLDEVGAYVVIHTDRLHVGIAGVLLGREVHLYRGCTEKIRSVFESSIGPHYATAQFHDAPPDAEALQRAFESSR